MINKYSVSIKWNDNESEILMEGLDRTNAERMNLYLTLPQKMQEVFALMGTVEDMPTEQKEGFESVTLTVKMEKQSMEPKES